MDKAEQIRHTRDQETERVNRGRVMKLPDHFDTSVVGVSFTPKYPDNFHYLNETWLYAEAAGEHLAAVIIRNPDNPYDANACEVHVPALGELGFVGHITKAMAARLAPELDAGVIWQGYVNYIKVNPEYPDRPGLEIRLERIDAHPE